MGQPEVWLRGPVGGIDPLLQPAAHALMQALEDVERIARALAPADLWRRPGQAASVGFHLKHLAGATDRLMSYATGTPLSDAQKAWLATEAKDGEPLDTTIEGLVNRFREVVDAGLLQLQRTAPAELTTGRTIGRAALPTTTLGCLFHAAEHASRHVGQLATTVKALQPNVSS